MSDLSPLCDQKRTSIAGLSSIPPPASGHFEATLDPRVAIIKEHRDRWFCPK
jgi:hypothetical protein